MFLLASLLTPSAAPFGRARREELLPWTATGITADVLLASVQESTALTNMRWRPGLLLTLARGELFVHGPAEDLLKLTSWRAPPAACQQLAAPPRSSASPSTARYERRDARAPPLRAGTQGSAWCTCMRCAAWRACSATRCLPCRRARTRAFVAAAA